MKSLKVLNFRSYKEASFDFSHQLNLMLGPNGAGKTNLLEAIYVLANINSWRARDKDLINYQADFYKLSGSFMGKTATISYRQSSQGPQKQLIYNGVPQRAGEYLGRTGVVLFEPGSLNIIIGTPQNRRRWLNRVLAVCSPQYLEGLIKYRQVLKQRNVLLRRASGQAIADQIFAWDVSLVEAATDLVKIRQKFINFINQQAADYYHNLGGKKSQISLVYSSNIESNDYSTKLLSKLEANIGRDSRLGFTSAGPHRDDVVISFNHKPAHLSASRGEIRTLVLAVKLLESKWLKKTSPENDDPMLLFDDIFSELDTSRRQAVLEHLKNNQVFITATDIKGLGPHLPKTRRIIKLP